MDSNRGENEKGSVFYIFDHYFKSGCESSSETMTDESGTLVSSSTSESESLIIQANTRCIFEGYGPNGEIRVRLKQVTRNSWSFFQRESIT